MIRCDRMVIVLVFIVSATAVTWAQQQVEFNYNGRVHVAGTPHDGTGYFKFTLMSKSPDVTLWANDGATLDGSEPSSSIATTVTCGFFSVDIGDSNVPNMAALNPTLFNRQDGVYLRSWFSDGAHGFELLQPDRRVVNPALLGTMAYEATELYVDPVNGSDANSGLSSGMAKATIQAAWDALPGIIETSATIHLATGMYRQSAVCRGRQVLGNGMVWIVGDPDVPMGVVLSGDTDTATSTAVVPVGLQFTDQQDVLLQGFTMQFYSDVALKVERRSRVDVKNCAFRFNVNRAIEYSKYADGSVRDTILHGPPRNDDGAGQGFGVSVLEASVEVEDCSIDDLSVGVHANYGRIGIKNSTIYNCYTGIDLITCAQVLCSSPITTVSACHFGVENSANSVLGNTAALSIINSYGSDIVSDLGAVSW